MAYLGTGRSFRGAPREAMVRTGAEPGHRAGRARRRADSPTLVEAEILPAGRSRTQVNRKVAHGRKDLAARRAVHHLLARGPGPDQRRPQGAARTARRHAGPARPRRRARGRRDRAGAAPARRRCCARPAAGSSGDVATTLDVWDQRLADAGQGPGRRPRALVARLEELRRPGLRAPGRDRRPTRWCSLRYQRSWEGDLLDALAAARKDDLRRGVNTVGPHRDELLIELDGREARTHASQGEQRCLALALRIGVHRLVAAPDRAGADPAARRRLLRARPGP